MIVEKGGVLQNSAFLERNGHSPRAVLLAALVGRLSLGAQRTRQRTEPAHAGSRGLQMSALVQWFSSSFRGTSTHSGGIFQRAVILLFAASLLLNLALLIAPLKARCTYTAIEIETS